MRLVRPIARLLLRHYWRIHVHGADQIPPTGPIILAANHLALLDGPVLVAVTPRLTFAMAKEELFVGRLGRFLSVVGQISLNRKEIDLRAVRRAVQVLRSGKVLAVFPEGVRVSGEVAWAKGGAAYLAMVTGATVVPVAILGTREPDQTKKELPRRGGPIHVVYGAPIVVEHRPWPRRKREVAELTEQLRRELAAHVVAAQALTGLPLPGPPKPLAPRKPQR